MGWAFRHSGAGCRALRAISAVTWEATISEEFAAHCDDGVVWLIIESDESKITAGPSSTGFIFAYASKKPLWPQEPDSPRRHSGLSFGHDDNQCDTEPDRYRRHGTQQRPSPRGESVESRPGSRCQSGRPLRLRRFLDRSVLPPVVSFPASAP